MKILRKVRVRNKSGLHTRPATMIVKILQNAKSSVEFTYRKTVVNAKSILNLLMLGVKENSQITITVDGEDAEEVMKSLVFVIENAFGERI